MGDSRVHIVDCFNSNIYPQDDYAERAIMTSIPLRASETEDAPYLAVVNRRLSAAITEFRPGFILYNAGTDCMMGDPLGQMRLTSDGIVRRDELVFRLLRSEAASFVRSAVREGDTSIQEAMRFMRQNATRALTVEQVARHVGMSGSHFAHRFSAVARVSPMRFLKQLRLDAARELMLGQSVRAGDAAAQVGYESASHFTRDFKQAFGSAPAEYVRRFRADGAPAQASLDAS
jgi:AraC-like DNA-binding protein